MVTIFCHDCEKEKLLSQCYFSETDTFFGPLEIKVRVAVVIKNCEMFGAVEINTQRMNCFR